MARQERAKADVSFIITPATTKYTSTPNVQKRTLIKNGQRNEVTRLTVEYILTDEIIDFIADNVVKIGAAEQSDKSMLRYYESQLKETQSRFRDRH